VSDVAEEWRPVPGYPAYVASRLGRIVSYVRDTPYEMLGSPHRFGYRLIELRGPDGVFHTTFHSVIASAFLGPRPPGMEVCHGDGNPLNNAVSNLRYGTHSENIQDRRKHGTDHNVNKTHCRNGHPYDEANTYHNPNKVGRYCRICQRGHKQQYKQRQRELAASLSAPREEAA
jgi:hypothetical protein